MSLWYQWGSIHKDRHKSVADICLEHNEHKEHNVNKTLAFKKLMNVYLTFSELEVVK